MFRLELSADDTDDPAFVSFIARLITGVVLTHRPPEVRIFKIDNWFDHKWLCFSGKILGAVGVWQKHLTVPPFAANRIVDQWKYVREEASGRYQLVGPGPNIHYQGPSAVNLQRSIGALVPSAALFWYSGNTKAGGRGSLMGYIPVEEDLWPWFLAFARAAEWRIAQRKNIHEYEARLFHQATESE